MKDGVRFYGFYETGSIALVLRAGRQQNARVG